MGMCRRVCGLLLLAILIAVGLAACSASTSSGRTTASVTGVSEPHFFVLQGGKYGFIDQTGKVRIRAQYSIDSVSQAWISYVMSDDLVSSEGLIPATASDGSWQFIDRTGKTIIEPQFDSAFPFREGLAAVSIGSRYGYIDKTGKYRINPQFDDAGFFFDGMARVQVAGKGYHIDKTGKKAAYAQEYDDVGRFSEGLAAVLKDKWGYIDKAGKLVINPQFDQAGEFHEGMALVEFGGKSAYIDKTGKIAFTEGADLFFEGLVSSHTSSTEGFPTDSVLLWQRFSEGLLPVYVGEKMGYVDKSGQIVIKATFDMVKGFSGGLAPVRLHSASQLQWGYIDKAGRIVINLQFDDAYPFANGLAFVGLGDRTGYIDKTGSYVWNPTK